MAGSRFCAACGAPQAQRCANCQAELQPGQRFCATCGAPAATRATVEAPQQKAPEQSPPPPRRRGGCCGGCALKILALLILLPTACTGAIVAYVAAPDLPPLGSFVPDLEALADHVPFFGPSTSPAPPRTPEEQQELEELRERLEAPRREKSRREEETLAQLQAAGLPVTGAFIVETGGGEPALLLGVSYAQMQRGSISSAGLEEGVQALLRVAETRTVDLTGLTYVTVAVRDSQGRTLFGVTGATADVERLRAGQISRGDFVRATAARAESRLGGAEALWLPKR